MKLLDDKLSELRWELYRKATDQLQWDVLKGTRWLLLKCSENLNADRSKFERLCETLRLNEILAIAYYRKEDLQLLWEEPMKRAAGRFLEGWIAQAEASGIQMLKTFTRTLARYHSGLLAWYEYSISAGPLEGVKSSYSRRLRGDVERSGAVCDRRWLPSRKPDLADF